MQCDEVKKATIPMGKFLVLVNFLLRVLEKSAKGSAPKSSKPFKYARGDISTKNLPNTLGNQKVPKNLVLPHQISMS